MTLNRQTLEKIDRRILSQLDHEDGVQLVKVPVSDAVWNTWRRYCDLAGVPMGRGLAILLEQELAAVVDKDLGGVAELVAEREQAVSQREEAVSAREAVVDRQQLELEVRERQLATRPMPPAVLARPPSRKPGRNEPCWCGSGKKFKVCHGRPNRIR